MMVSPMEKKILWNENFYCFGFRENQMEKNIRRKLCL